MLIVDNYMFKETAVYNKHNYVIWWWYFTLVLGNSINSGWHYTVGFIMFYYVLLNSILPQIWLC